MIQKIKKILAIIKQKSPMYMELKEKVIEAENAKGADLIKLCGRISREIIETSDLKKILEKEAINLTLLKDDLAKITFRPILNELAAEAKQAENSPFELIVVIKKSLKQFEMFKLTETETSFYLKALNDKIEEFIPELEKSATYFQQTNQKKPEALAHFANLSKKILQINHNFGDICHHAEYLEKWVNHLRRIAIGSWNQLLKLFKQSLRSLAKQQKQKIRFSRDSGLDHLEVD